MPSSRQLSASKGKSHAHDWNEIKVGDNTFTIEYPEGNKQGGKAKPEDIQFSYAL